jgi:hypothetical protein
MVEDGDIKPIVDLIYSFENGIDAYYIGYRQSQRKVIISMSKLFNTMDQITVFLYKQRKYN